MTSTGVVTSMKPFAHFPPDVGRSIQFVLTDIDDTLTFRGRLSARTYEALERLHEAGVKVVPVSAAPAGWCDQMARMWPVDGIIGENGGLFFGFDHTAGVMRRRFWLDDDARCEAMQHLTEAARKIVVEVPGAEIATDQCYRETTLAMSFGSAEKHAHSAGIIADLLRGVGARATINSLWVIGWFGRFDKFSMTRRIMAEVFGMDISAVRDHVVYVGDSLNARAGSSAYRRPGI